MQERVKDKINRIAVIIQKNLTITYFFLFLFYCEIFQ
jgi:hypothetical protein